MQINATALLIALGHLILGILILVAAKFIRDWLSPYSSEAELTERDNPAFGLALAGYYAAVIIIYIAVANSMTGPAEEGTSAVLMAWGADLLWSLAGIAALAASRYLMNLFLMGGTTYFSDEIIRTRNVAAGAVECGVYIASGIVVASVLREPNGNLLTGVVFFVLSEAALLLLGRLYSRSIGYDMTSEVRGNNLAAGVPLGLTLVAFGLLLAKANSGEFVDWPTNLGYFAFDCVAGLLLLLALRWLTDLALLPRATIAEEIVRDRNVNAGLIEGVIALGIAALILYVF